MTDFTNADRVRRCQSVLNSYTDFDERTNLIDLLADARHWCDRRRLCYGELDRIAHSHYLAELFDESNN